MSVAIFGRLRNLSICFSGGDKYFYGEVAVQGSSFTMEAFSDQYTRLASWVEGFLNIYAQGSEELQSRLVVSDSGGQNQPMLDRYSELKNFVEVQRYPSESRLTLFITVMLNTADFNSFGNLVEAHYCGNLEYLMQLPIYGFSVNEQARADLLASHGHVVPTRQEFQSGKPILITNEGISCIFRHLSDEEVYKYNSVTRSL